MDADGSDQTCDIRLRTRSGSDWSPTVPDCVRSRHARWIAQIVVMDADGSDSVQITSDQAVNFGPTWSPDGTQIAFVKAESNGTRDVWVMGADGTSAHRLAPGAGVQFVPAWQPRGDRLP
jgi:hypothetical protein